MNPHKASGPNPISITTNNKMYNGIYSTEPENQHNVLVIMKAYGEELTSHARPTLESINIIARNLLSEIIQKKGFVPPPSHQEPPS